MTGPAQFSSFRNEALHYMLRMPPGNLPPPWPLLLFLHGAGERGGVDGRELGKVMLHGPWKEPDVDRFCVLAPQCPSGCVWPGIVDDVVKLVKEVCDKHPIDKTRCCATGLSIGGFGCWALAARDPTLFSAIMPICGGFALPSPRTLGLTALLRSATADPQPKSLKLVKNLPAWIFHGQNDKIVDVNASKRLYELLGGNSRPTLKLTVFKEAGHQCWTQAYRQQGIFEWLLQQGGGQRVPMVAPSIDSALNAPASSSSSSSHPKSQRTEQSTVNHRSRLSPKVSTAAVPRAQANARTPAMADQETSSCGSSSESSSSENEQIIPPVSSIGKLQNEDLDDNEPLQSIVGSKRPWSEQNFEELKRQARAIQTMIRDGHPASSFADRSNGL